MLHVSGGHLINDTVKNSQLHIIKDCNHVMQLDQPKKVTKLLLEFINN